MLKNDKTCIPMSFSQHIITFFALTVCLASCNDEVFVEPIEVSPLTETIDHTGGAAHFKANQKIVSTWMLVYRWVNGRAQALGDDGIQFSLYDSSPELRITNDLCDLTFDISKGDELTITSGYNLFADTIYMNLEIIGEYESTERGVRLLPQPGFGHGKISYDLDCWEYKEQTDTLMIAQIGGASDHDATLTLHRKGEVAARRSEQFKPWDKLLSDNIFGRDSFKVEGVRYNPSMWSPELSGEMISYTSAVKHFDTEPLLYDEDVTVTVSANSWAKVRLIIKGEYYGIGYRLPAISTIAGVDDKTIDGVYWLSVPVSYSIETETGPIRP